MNRIGDCILLTYPPGQPADPGTTLIRSDKVQWADPGEEFQELGAQIEHLVDQVEDDKLDRMASTRVRSGQDRFRKALFELRGSRCEITGLPLEDALEAAHIAPWRNGKGKLDPENGIVLAAHIHRLFDAGRLDFDDDGNVTWNGIDPDHVGVRGKKITVSEGRRHYLMMRKGLMDG